MTVRKVAARDIIIQISDGAVSPTWLGISGLGTLNLNPGENEEVANTVDQNSGGEYEGLVMQRGGTFKIEGFNMRDHLTDAQDPGQARCETLGTLKGYDSLGQIRFRYPTSSLWKVWTCFASLGDQGGGTNDMGGWSCTFTRSGAATTAAAP